MNRLPNANPGPDPDRLKIDEDDWKEAVKKGLAKGKPMPGELRGEPKPKKSKCKKAFPARGSGPMGPIRLPSPDSHLQFLHYSA